jgi:hypothetical protein
MNLTRLSPVKIVGEEATKILLPYVVWTTLSFQGMRKMLGRRQCSVGVRMRRCIEVRQLLVGYFEYSHE